MSRKKTEGITEPQAKTLRMICEILDANGLPPTVKELADALGISHEPAKRMTSMILSRSNGGQQINAAWMQELAHLALIQDPSTAEAASDAASADMMDPLAGLLDLKPHPGSRTGAALADPLAPTAVGISLETSIPRQVTSTDVAQNAPPSQSRALQRARTLRGGTTAVSAIGSGR